MGQLLGTNHVGTASPPDPGGEELLVAVHGLGGTGDLWGPVLTDRADGWPGWWWAPDLVGHGTTGGRLDDYTFRAMAEDLAGRLPPAASYVVLGHSLGGVVGLELARLVPTVRRVVGFGMKVVWSDEDLARASQVAARPVAWFDTEPEAIARHRKVSGVGDLVGDDIARAGVVEEGGRWRLALDPLTFAIGRPEVSQLLDGCPAEALLARGEHDAMVSDADLAALVPDPVTLTGLGHLAHLEDPSAVLSLL